MASLWSVGTYLPSCSHDQTVNGSDQSNPCSSAPGTHAPSIGLYRYKAVCLSVNQNNTFGFHKVELGIRQLYEQYTASLSHIVTGPNISFTPGDDHDLPK